MVPCAVRNRRMVMNTQDTTPSSPTTPRLLDLFPCQSGDLARKVPSPTRNQKGVSLGHLRKITKKERMIEIAYNVSTELPSFKDFTRVVPSATSNKRGVSLSHLRNITKKERKREISYKVSTELPSFKDLDIWPIKKTLKKSDVNGQTRFLIPKKDVIKHIFKYLSEEEIELVHDEENQGLRINVFDSDERSTHQMTFKKWKSSGSYVLNNNWNKEFNKRRHLKIGNELGLFWNPYASRLHFRVLHR